MYGSSDKHKRQHMLYDLRVMSQIITSPWIILGDFNCVANLDERIGSPVRLAEVQPFRDCMAMSGSEISWEIFYLD